MEKYEITVKKTVMETYEVEAWSAKQAKAEWESLVKDTPPTFGKSEVKRVSVSKMDSGSDADAKNENGTMSGGSSEVDA